jgi:hypothetical protein
VRLARLKRVRRLIRLPQMSGTPPRHVRSSVAWPLKSSHQDRP